MNPSQAGARRAALAQSELIETILRHGGKRAKSGDRLLLLLLDGKSARDLGLELVASGFIDVNLADEPVEGPWSVTG